MHDLEEELPAHPETAAEHVLSMEWLVGEVVGVQHAIALYPLSLLALHATWRRTTALRLRHLHVQLGERCENLQVLFTFGDLGALLLQEFGEQLLVVGIHGEYLALVRVSGQYLVAVGVHGRIRPNIEHLAGVGVGARSRSTATARIGRRSGGGGGVELGGNDGEQ